MTWIPQICSPRRRGPVKLCALVIVAVWAVGETAEAQLYEVRPGQVRRGQRERARRSALQRSPGRDASRSRNKTILEVELVTGRSGAPLAAQRWQRAFQSLGHPVRIRRGLPTDEYGVDESQFGPLRRVKVLAKLERDGTIKLPSRSFSPGDGAKLKEWLQELETYGAQGAPDGKPLWGLSKPQFTRLRRSLTKTIEEDVQGRPLAEALEALGLPPQHPIRMTTEAKVWTKKHHRTDPGVQGSVTGFSLGTGLAALLNEYGLGFRPLRTPEGRIELAVAPLESVANTWPVGWPLEGTDRRKHAPKMFELVPVELEDAPLKDVLEAIAEKTETPVVVDHYGLRQAGVDVAELRVSYPARRTSWSLLLRGLLNPHKLTRRFRTDEAGNGFCWVTVLRPSIPDR